MSDEKLGASEPAAPTCKHGKTARQECSECAGGFDNASPQIEEPAAKPEPLKCECEPPKSADDEGYVCPIHPREAEEPAGQDFMSAERFYSTTPGNPWGEGLSYDCDDSMRDVIFRFAEAYADARDHHRDNRGLETSSGTVQGHEVEGYVRGDE